MLSRKREVDCVLSSTTDKRNRIQLKRSEVLATCSYNCLAGRNPNT